MTDRLHDTASWAAHAPLVFLLGTLAAYRVGCELRDRTRHPLAQPVLVAVVLVGGALLLADADYADYRAGVEPIAFLLGPATVALAVPLHRQAHRLRGLLLPLLVATVLGAVVSVTTGVLLARALGAGDLLQRSIAPKSVTAPVAIALSDHLDGVPQLTAVFAILVGTLGAVAGPTVLTLLRVRDRRARGIALGAVSHGIGTSRALRESATEGAFSGLSMGLSALATSILLPVLAKLLF